MDQYGIADRRSLRRKLTFWRLAAFVALAAIIAGLGYYFQAPGGYDRPHVAKVKVSGLITDDQGLVDRLDHIAKNDTAKALIVEINSPGGTTYGGEAIFNAIRRVAAKKPVVAEIRTLGASAAYMVAAAGDHIVASETSVVGSIGVIFQYPQVADLLNKVGVGVNEIKSAPLKAEPSPFHPPSEAAKQMIRSVVMDTYGWFVDLVAKRRHLTHDKALALSDGRVFSGRQALENGLIDELGSDRQARQWLAKKGVSPNLPVIESKPQNSSGWGLFGKAASGLFDAVAGRETPLGAALGRLADRKLFLDGLVSLWQFGPQQAGGE